MCARLPVLLFLLLSWLGGTAVAQAPLHSEEQRQVRRLTLAPAPPRTPPEISIRPGTASLLLFDAALARDGVELEGRERFNRVVVGEDTLALLPSEALREGERLRLTMRFAKGVAPAEVRFHLLVVSGRADAQVEVMRSQSPSEPTRRESSASEASELLRLREENTRLRAARGPTDLTGALAASWMQDQGIAASQLKRSPPRVTGAELQQIGALSFRAATRVAVRWSATFSRNERPWSLGHAALIDAEGRRLRIVQTWQAQPTAEGFDVIVEAEAARHEAHGSYTLELREAGGDRTLTLSAVTFPDL